MSAETDAALAAGQAIMDRLGIACQIGRARPHVRPADGKDGKPWPAVERVYTFSRGTVVLDFPYHMGLGHLNWKAAASNPRRFGCSDNNRPILNTLEAHGTPKDAAAAASIAARIANKSGEAKAHPVKVLHCLAGDGAALYQTFSEWAGDLGYDSDSIKAMRTWEACCDTGRQLLRLMTQADVDAFAALEL